MVDCSNDGPAAAGDGAGRADAEGRTADRRAGRRSTVARTPAGASVQEAGVPHRRFDRRADRGPCTRPAAAARRWRTCRSGCRAYLMGAGLDSRNRARWSGASRSRASANAARSPFRQACHCWAQSAGATLAVTEMQPCPPWAKNAAEGRILARQLTEFRSDLMPHPGRPAEIVGGVLDAEQCWAAPPAGPWSPRSCRPPIARGCCR